MSEDCRDRLTLPNAFDFSPLFSLKAYGQPYSGIANVFPWCARY
jgi:hypothetical protein